MGFHLPRNERFLRFTGALRGVGERDVGDDPREPKAPRPPMVDDDIDDAMDAATAEKPSLAALPPPPPSRHERQLTAPPPSRRGTVPPSSAAPWAPPPSREPSSSRGNRGLARRTPEARTIRCDVEHLPPVIIAELSGLHHTEELSDDAPTRTIDRNEIYDVLPGGPRSAPQMFPEPPPSAPSFPPAPLSARFGPPPLPPQSGVALPNVQSIAPGMGVPPTPAFHAYGQPLDFTPVGVRVAGLPFGAPAAAVPGMPPVSAAPRMPSPSILRPQLSPPMTLWLAAAILLGVLSYHLVPRAVMPVSDSRPASSHDASTH